MSTPSGVRSCTRSSVSACSLLSTFLCTWPAAFQVFDSLQAVSSYVRGIICAQAFLKGIVGKEVS